MRGLDSPVPTQTMLGSLGATATAPRETVASRSNWCSKVMPLLTVLSRPPDAVASQKVVGSDALTAMSVMRPPMLAGPMLRHSNALIQAGSTVGFGAAGAPVGRSTACEACSGAGVAAG